MEADDLASRSLLEPLPDQPRLHALVVGTDGVDGVTRAGQSQPRVIDARAARPADGDTIAPSIPHRRP